MESDAADLRVRPIATDDLVEDDGWLTVPAAGTVVTDADVQALCDADQR
ncbi:MAG: hypothetical protein JNL54_14400 [Kineosporiaceae bacterium]|nr:hypothetical protein [Kineosporiaceae bacterium]